MLQYFFSINESQKLLKKKIVHAIFYAKNNVLITEIDVILVNATVLVLKNDFTLNKYHHQNLK